MRKISVIGTGYVGLVTGTCLSDFGLEVICIDKDEEKIKQLKSGKIPIYEPGLEDMVERNVYYRRIEFTTDLSYAIQNSDVIFICVGTPPLPDGSADLSFIMDVAEEIAYSMNGYKVIVDKSTVPVGTGTKVRERIEQTMERVGNHHEFDIISNPEFLREGSAIYDFTHPDKIVIGSDSEKAIEIMKSVYRVLYLNDTPFISTNIETAELIKYANNALLAMKISFINEISNLCEIVGANVQHLAKAIGRDGRIGPKFLHAGPGFGGSCFPKDTHALLQTSREVGLTLKLVTATIEVNENQRKWVVEKIEKVMGVISGTTICILGLTFKPYTDDTRDAPALYIIRQLVEKGAKIKTFDPEGIKETKHKLADISESIQYCSDEYEAIDLCDALVIVTEWHQFRNLDMGKVKGLLKANIFFDLRNIYNKQEMIALGFEYYGVGI